jgi:hypothetical protein
VTIRLQQLGLAKQRISLPAIAVEWWPKSGQTRSEVVEYGPPVIRYSCNILTTAPNDYQSSLIRPTRHSVTLRVTGVRETLV